MKANLLLGDCVEKLKELDSESIDMALTSPPYDDMDENFNPISKNGLRKYNGYSWDFKGLANELFRVLKQGGVLVWVVNDPTINGSESLASSLQKIYFRRIGFNIHDTMIYRKISYLPQNQHPRYAPVFEYMIVLCKGYPPKTFNALKEKAKPRLTKSHGQRNKNNLLRHKDKKAMTIADTKRKTNIWSYDANGYVGLPQGLHVAPFNEFLVSDHILSWSNPGDTVLDPMMGSGTTGKMALKNGRDFIGIELSKEYFEIAKHRIGNIHRQ